MTLTYMITGDMYASFLKDFLTVAERVCHFVPEDYTVNYWHRFCCRSFIIRKKRILPASLLLTICGNSAFLITWSVKLLRIFTIKNSSTRRLRGASGINSTSFRYRSWLVRDNKVLKKAFRRYQMMRVGSQTSQWLMKVCRKSRSRRK